MNVTFGWSDDPIVNGRMSFMIWYFQHRWIDWLAFDTMLVSNGWRDEQ